MHICAFGRCMSYVEWLTSCQVKSQVIFTLTPILVIITGVADVQLERRRKDIEHRKQKMERGMTMYLRLCLLFAQVLSRHTNRHARGFSIAEDKRSIWWLIRIIFSTLFNHNKHNIQVFFIYQGKKLTVDTTWYTEQGPKKYILKIFNNFKTVSFSIINYSLL